MSGPLMRVTGADGPPVDRFQVLGDRCSGTNWLHALMVANAPELQEATDYHWKHGFVDRRIAARRGLLTLIVVRHPLRWMQAVHRRPWELSAAMKGLSFSDFIRAEWRAAWTDDEGREHAIQGDMRPHTDRPFGAAAEMRAAKLNWLTAMLDEPGRMALLRYEDLNARPAETIAAILAAADLPPPRPFRPVRAYKGRAGAYRPRAPRAVSAADLAFMAEALDLKAEAALGYDLTAPPPRDGLAWWDRRALAALVRPRR